MAIDATQGDWRTPVQAAMSRANGAASAASTAQGMADTAKAAAESAAEAAASAQTAANAAEALANLSRIDFGVLSFQDVAIIAAALGPQSIAFDVPAAKAGDRVNLYPASVPAGYAILGNGYSPANGKVAITIQRPLLAIATKINLSVRAIAYRDAV